MISFAYTHISLYIPAPKQLRQTVKQDIQRVYNKVEHGFMETKKDLDTLRDGMTAVALSFVEQCSC